MILLASGPVSTCAGAKAGPHPRIIIPKPAV